MSIGETNQTPYGGDDLIERLSDSCYLAFEDGTNDFSAAQEAIDRIEQLAATCEQLELELYEMNELYGAVKDGLEEKLAKAMEALREIAGSVPYADNPWHIALAALAELEK